MKPISKAKCCRIHTKKRMKQRYGIELNSGEHKDIVKSIQEGKAIFIKRRSLSRSTFLVLFKKKQIIVVYDKIRKVLITALPMDALP